VLSPKDAAMAKISLLPAPMEFGMHQKSMARSPSLSSAKSPVHPLIKTSFKAQFFKTRKLMY
jgi:hypothetical protein